MGYATAAKYTRNDYEVKKLKPVDKINYDFYLINYDVDANQEVANGLNALKTSKKTSTLLGMLSNPKQIHVFITAVILLVLVISLILMLVYYLYVVIKKQKLKQEMLNEGILVLLGFILFVVVFGAFFSFITKEIWKAYVMIPSGKEGDEVPDDE